MDSLGVDVCKDGFDVSVVSKPHGCRAPVITKQRFLTVHTISLECGFSTLVT